MTDRADRANLESLSLLLASFGVLPALATTRKAAEFALEVLKSVYAGAPCAVCVRGVDGPLGDLPAPECAACSRPSGAFDRLDFPCALAERPDVRALAVRTLHGHYGYLMVGEGPSEERGRSERDPYMVNFANSVATSIENRWQRRQLEESNARLISFGEQLQHMVDLRTQELADSNARLRLESRRNEVLLRNSSDGIHILDSGGNVLEVSDAFCEMLGYTREELLGANVSRWTTRRPPEAAQERVVALIAKLAPATFETAIKRRDGTVVDVEITTRPVELDGDVVLFNSARDITKRKSAEHALRESERRYHGLFDQAHDGLIVMTLGGRLLDANRAFAEMHGYTTDELKRMDISQLDVLRERTLEERAELAQRLQSGEILSFDVEHLHKDGHILTLSVTSSVVDFGGEPCYLALHQDVTERRHLEQVHLRAQKLESLGTLTGGIAHDFNNILAAIQGNADLAELDLGPDHPAAESLRELRKASTRATELVRRIMAFAHPEESRTGVVELGVVVSEVLKLLRATLPARIGLNLQIAEDTPLTLADEGQVHEAIVNLTTNAAHAIGPKAGSIDYRLEPAEVDEELARSIPGVAPGRYARLTVADTGCGMDAATMERIFDAFFTTKAAGEGTGLGLSMVHGIMKGHGGGITVESEPGKGSSFMLYFPAASAAVARSEVTEQSPIAPVVGRRALYVDDEEALVHLARRVLLRLGYEVSGFTDPEAALAAFREDPHGFDVVITDLSMPGMSGFEFARAVTGIRSDVPVLMTTGNIGTEDEERARAAGIRELALKPVTVGDLGRLLDGLALGGDGGG